MPKARMEAGKELLNQPETNSSAHTLLRFPSLPHLHHPLLNRRRGQAYKRLLSQQRSLRRLNGSAPTSIHNAQMSYSIHMDSDQTHYTIARLCALDAAAREPGRKG
ncbi:hypothetical protein BLNAU_6919 [Blattamonas nauphoetae]|uniref:Uncharacterized protein n=1 Tax=Blattamonas nauphoetae TaxID=2049346 RepID=A0ABQ9Y399_9EUKA|nr:hypothetical protein BLNAU_6919 [Blattamonas nauphoetae]